MPNSVVELIADRAVDFKLHAQLVEIRLAHLHRPPQARIREDELRKLVRSERHVFGFVRCQFHILLERDVLDLALELPFTG